LTLALRADVVDVGQQIGAGIPRGRQEGDAVDLVYRQAIEGTVWKGRVVVYAEPQLAARRRRVRLAVPGGVELGRQQVPVILILSVVQDGQRLRDRQPGVILGRGKDGCELRVGHVIAVVAPESGAADEGAQVLLFAGGRCGGGRRWRRCRHLCGAYSEDRILARKRRGPIHPDEAGHQRRTNDGLGAAIAFATATSPSILQPGCSDVAGEPYGNDGIAGGGREADVDANALIGAIAQAVWIGVRIVRLAWVVGTIERGKHHVHRAAAAGAPDAHEARRDLVLLHGVEWVRRQRRQRRRLVDAGTRCRIDQRRQVAALVQLARSG
jgi:hypothetical protein